MQDTRQLRTALKRTLVGSGVSQREVAVAMDIGEDLLSRYLGGSRKLPDNFTADFMRAFDEVRAEKGKRLLAGLEVAA